MTDFDPNATISTSTPETVAPAERTSSEADVSRSVRYHPIRGAVWGLVLGLGLGIYALIFRVIEFRQLPFWIIVLVGVLLGVLWARFAPPKR